MKYTSSESMHAKVFSHLKFTHLNLYLSLSHDVTWKLIIFKMVCLTSCQHIIIVKKYNDIRSVTVVQKKLKMYSEVYV